MELVPNKKWVIAPRFLTLQEGVSKEEVRKWLENEYLLLYREFPGLNAMVGEPVSSSGRGTPNDNYKEKDDFVLIYFFDSKETKDHYWPEDGRISEDVIKGIAKHQSTFDKGFEYFDTAKYQMEEYLMFARSK